MKLLTYLQLHHGLSRRTSTSLIQQHQIFLNDELVESFKTELHPGDTLVVEGAKYIVTLPDTDTHTGEIIRFHKPIGYVVSRSDPHNATIFELLPEGRSKTYYPIGRLDKDSSGLVLLTTTPALVHELLHPSKKLEKIYEVVVSKARNPEDTAEVKEGFLLNDHGEPPAKNEPADLLKFLNIKATSQGDGSTLLKITLHEGKKRHIRRVLRYLGYPIISLKRISFGERTLEDLPVGKRKK